jgi:transcription termination/antitermination protein NusG
MTELANEIAHFPRGADLFDDARAGDADGWHVLHTRSRQEKVVASDLDAMGIAHFLPLVKQVRYHGRRKVRVSEPLFPGYVFLRGSLEDVYRIDRTRRVATIIRVRDQQKLRWELRNIHLALLKDVPLDPFPYLKEGVRVVVRAGPLEGVEGLIRHRWASDRLILQVDLLGRAVSLEIDGSLLEVLD